MNKPKFAMEIPATSIHGTPVAVTIIDFIVKSDTIYAICLRNNRFEQYKLSHLTFGNIGGTGNRPFI